MHRPSVTTPDETRLEARRRLRGTMGLLSVGLAVLAFLVAIDRPEWFHARPANGATISAPHTPAAQKIFKTAFKATDSAKTR